MDSRSSSPLRRSSARYKPLPKVDPQQVLANLGRAGYTYHQGGSYNPSYPMDYVTPNLIGFGDESSMSDDGSNSGQTKKSKISVICNFIVGILSWIPFLSYIVQFFKNLRFSGGKIREKQESVENKRKWNWFWWILVVFALICLLHYGFERKTDEIQRKFVTETKPDDGVVVYGEKSKIALKNNDFVHNEFTFFYRKISNFVSVIFGFVLHPIDFTMDAASRYLESLIFEIFEKESIKLEKEQINQWMKEKETKVTDQGLSSEEVNRIVQKAINELNISAIVRDIVKNQMESNNNNHINEQFVENHLNFLISDVLKKFSYDRTGEPDFALESAGGFVVSTRCTESYDEKSRRESIFGIPLWFTSYSPRSVIQRKSQNLNAGECWAIKGSQSYLVIQLARRIDVTAVSYEHLPKELSISGNIDSAPKDFKIWSLETENDPNKFLIGEYRFEEDGEPLQRFTAQHHDPRGTVMIEFEVTSNYGASFTCLYRFRVHGNPLD